MNIKPLSIFSVTVKDQNFLSKAVMCVNATSKANAFYIVSNMLKGSTATPIKRSVEAYKR